MHRCAEALYVSNDEHRRTRDPRSQLLIALAALGLVIASTYPALPVLVLACCIVRLVRLRASLWGVLGRLVAPLGMAVVVTLVRTFSSGVTPLCSWDVGPWHLTATREGLDAGTLIASRVVAGVAVILVLARQTSFQDMVAALAWARVPRVGLEIALLMYRYTFLFFEQAASIVSAQRVRLGYSGLRSGLSSLGSLSGMVLLRSLEQVERTHEAMVARGGNGTLPIFTLPPMPRREWGRATAWISLIALAFLIAERWPR